MNGTLKRTAALAAMAALLIAAFCIAGSDMSYAEAAEGDAAALQKAVEKAGTAQPFVLNTTWNTGSDHYIGIDAPAPNAVYYFDGKKMENMKISLICYATWDGYNTIPVTGIFKTDGTLLERLESDVPVNEKQGYSIYNISTTFKGYKAGKFLIYTFAVPCDEKGNPVDGWDTWDNVPNAVVLFSMAKLKAPAGLKVKAGKKKVTVTFKKAKGAKSYQIFRSTKKGKGYKKIGTVSKCKFVDKKAKSGKRYYYKVRSVRGKLSSGFTSPKRSGKVK